VVPARLFYSLVGEAGNMKLTFPKDFVWGVAASAYQIEGAWNEDGKGPSIWDTFSHTSGNVANNQNGDVAIDHYHHWQEDLDLMAALKVRSYRFSIAWSRILPAGRGTVNTRGLDFYNRLVDGCLSRGIEPTPCLFHYDLPQALQDEKGGWKNRDTAYHFAEYARVVTERLSDRVTTIMTHNEPWVTAIAGYMIGIHAPGEKNIYNGLKTLHHVMLSHGLAAEAIRTAARKPVKVGITLNLSPFYPATNSKWDVKAARDSQAMINRSTLDPLLLGTTPLTENWMLKWLVPSFIKPGDMEKIRSLDLLGINYYSRNVMKFSWKNFLVFAEEVKPEGNEYSEMWEIYPPGMFDLLKQIWDDYYVPAVAKETHMPELMVTENGVPVTDVMDSDGQVHDDLRIRYLRDHIAQVHRAIQAGVDIKGYYVWSFADNFEWNLGYGKRFGLIHVNYETMQRTMKDSGTWYSKVIKENSLEIAGE
jgi:beta-glucosidase